MAKLNRMARKIADLAPVRYQVPVLGLDRLPRLDRVALKETVASALWRRN